MKTILKYKPILTSTTIIGVPKASETAINPFKIIVFQSIRLTYYNDISHGKVNDSFHLSYFLKHWQFI